MASLLLIPAALAFVPQLAPIPGNRAARTAVATAHIAEPLRAAATIFMAADAMEEVCDALPDAVCDDVEADADAVFAVIDENGDGSITRDELLKHLTKAGYTEKAVNLIFDKLDTDKSEEISKEELRAGFLQYTPLREAPGLGRYNSDFVVEIHADADTLFNAIDTDGSGTISKEELRNHLKEFSDYSFKAISKMFKLLDVNKDGEIEKEELRDAFVKYSALRQAIGEGPNFK